jgi:glycerol kinase
MNMAKRAVLAVDQGTTNSKAILLAPTGAVIARGAAPVETKHPRSGWVEQDPRQIWKSVLAAIQACLGQASDFDIAALGISNQRESVLIWDRKTGAPLGPAVTWQCRRTAAACEKLKADGHEMDVISRTGLPLDPLFPSTKVGWLLDNHGQGRPADNICLGTVDAWLIWNFSGGAVHATDSSNAARTQLYNIAQGRWDDDLCRLFGVPPAILPEVRDSAAIFGETAGVAGLPDGLPIASAIGDSHGALFGHGAFTPGDGKITFGTGSSVMTTVPKFLAPPKGITATIAWSLDGKPTFALEGNILVSAAILPWAADLLGVGSVDELLQLAQTVANTEGVALVPAHVGLGSPHWNANSRGVLCGLSFAAKPAHVALAAAQSMALQVYDVFKVMASDAGQKIGKLFVDGGPSQNRFLMALVAGYLNHAVIISESAEASARGAAYLAGLATGIWPDQTAVATLGGQGDQLDPAMEDATREATIAAWRTAIDRCLLGT